MWAAFKSWKEPWKECVPQRRPDFSQLDFSPTNNKVSISSSQFVAIGWRGGERRETLPDLTPVSRLLVCHTITLTWQPCSHTRVLGQLTLPGSSTPFYLTISYPLWSQPSSSWRKAFPDTAQTQLNFASRASQPQERMLCPFQLLAAARFPFHVHRSNFKLSKCKS